MAITTSAKKALCVSDRKRAVNLRRQRGMKDGIKAVQKMAGAGMTKDTSAALAAAYKAIDKAAKNGLIKKNTAARRKARLSRLLKKTK
jgi:small subunit ribosomal protein S20